MPSRQKITPRYAQDTVSADLPIHIYTSKKRAPWLNQTEMHSLLQDSDASGLDDKHTRDKT